MRLPYRPSADLSAINTFFPLPFLARYGNFTAGARAGDAFRCDDVPLILGFFAAGLRAVFAFLRASLISSSPALSNSSSLSSSSSSSSSSSDASFSTTSSPLFLFALEGATCDDATSGTNLGGAFTARPLLRLLPVAGELAMSLLEISMRGILCVVVIEAFDCDGVISLICVEIEKAGASDKYGLQRDGTC